MGSATRVREEIEQVVAETAADEFIITTTGHDQAARTRSYELIAREIGLNLW